MAEKPAPTNPEKETITREIFRSGFAIDSRMFPPLYVRQLAENTQYLMGKSGLKIPVRPGHADPKSQREQPAQGWITAIRIKPVDKSEDLIIEADIELQGDLLKTTKAGELPNQSIGWSPAGMTQDGGHVGQYIQHLALLGNDAPAEPALNLATKSDNAMIRTLKRLASAVKSIANYQSPIAEPTEPTEVQSLIFDKAKFTRGEVLKWAADHNFKHDKVDETTDSFRLRQAEPSDFEDNSFKTIELKPGIKTVIGKKKGVTATMEKADPKMMMESLDIIRGEIDKMVKYLEGEAPVAEKPMPEDEVPADAAKMDDYAAKIAALEAEKAALTKQVAQTQASAGKVESDTVFTQLHTAGKVLAGDREIFDMIAAKRGLTAARDHFAAHTAAVNPPGLTSLGSANDALNESDTNLFNMYKKAGISDVNARGMIAASKTKAVV